MCPLVDLDSDCPGLIPEGTLGTLPPGKGCLHRPSSCPQLSSELTCPLCLLPSAVKCQSNTRYSIANKLTPSEKSIWKQVGLKP